MNYILGHATTPNELRKMKPTLCRGSCAKRFLFLATATNLIGTIPLMRICSAMNRKAAKNPVANFIQARVIGNLIHGNGGTYLADSSCARAMERAMMADASKEFQGTRRPQPIRPTGSESSSWVRLTEIFTPSTSASVTIPNTTYRPRLDHGRARVMRN
jgi:hypothetical protein